MGPPLRPVGVVIGLAGCVAVGMAIHFLIQSGSCGGDMPACSEDVGWTMLLLVGGLLAAILSIFIGGGWVAFCGLFLAIGLGALATLLPLNDGKAGGADPLFAILFGGGFVLGGLSPLLLGLWARGKAADAARLVATGKSGVGTITEVRDTGVTINDNPRVGLTMRVAPSDGSAPMTLHKDVTVSRLAIPRAGERYPVWYDPTNTSRWALGTDVQPEASQAVKALFERARRDMGATFAGDVISSADVPDPIDEIARLAGLRDSGAITDDEYQATKARLLSRVGGA